MPRWLQPPGRQGQHDLHRHILAPAKGPADGRIDDPHLLERQPQRVGDLLLVFVRPLPGHLHGHPAFFIDIASPASGCR
jgi:hypothetical protein